MKYSVLLICVCMLFSCKKGQADITIVGNIYDQTFSRGLADATIVVYKSDAGNTSSEVFQTIYTDSEGNFKFTVKRDQFNFLDLKVSKDAYFNETERLFFKDLSVSKDNVANINMNGKSWAKVRFVHTSSDQSVMNYYITEGKTNCEECCVAGLQTIHGIVDTTFYCVNNALTNYELTYTKVGSASEIRTVQTPFNDTVLVEIQY